MILVDIYEPDSIYEGISTISGIAERRGLEVGDYCFQTVENKMVLIERKSINDLLGSMSSGRLHRQVRNLLATDCIPMLLIEGYMGSDRHGKIKAYRGRKVSSWPYTTIQNFLISGQLNGLYIVQSSGTFCTAKVICSLYDYFQKKEHTSLIERQVKVKSVSQTDTNSRQTALVAAIPGVGIKLARTLLKRFGSPRCIADATIDELCTVNGVGKKKAELIKEILG